MGPSKICLFEIGDGDLTPDEQLRIREALIREAALLRGISLKIESGQVPALAGVGGEL